MPSLRHLPAAQFRPRRQGGGAHRRRKSAPVARTRSSARWWRCRPGWTSCSPSPDDRGPGEGDRGCPQPWIDGACVGAGAILAMASDMRIGTARSKVFPVHPGASGGGSAACGRAALHRASALGLLQRVVEKPCRMRHSRWRTRWQRPFATPLTSSWAWRRPSRRRPRPRRTDRGFRPRLRRSRRRPGRCSSLNVQSDPSPAAHANRRACRIGIVAA